MLDTKRSLLLSSLDYCRSRGPSQWKESWLAERSSFSKSTYVDNQERQIFPCAEGTKKYFSFCHLGL